MKRLATVCFCLPSGLQVALADAVADCNQATSADVSIKACLDLIAVDPTSADLYYNRGNAYARKGSVRPPHWRADGAIPAANHIV
jgi:hypothetical protein